MKTPTKFPVVKPKGFAPINAGYKPSELMSRMFKFVRRLYIRICDPLVQVAPGHCIRPSDVAGVHQLEAVRHGEEIYLQRVRIDTRHGGTGGGMILIEREFLENVLERLGQPKWLTPPAAKEVPAAQTLGTGGETSVGAA